MQTETKSCQNCKQDFVIEPEDFLFYKKISVPPPTWCPQCRMMRKMAWGFDSVSLYQRTCQALGHSEKIISCYDEASPLTVYDHAYWRSDAWDPLSYGREYDFNTSFFEQFKKLIDSVPVRNVEVINSVDCDYCVTATDSKNCYQCSGIFGTENSAYSHASGFSKECLDTHLSLFNEQLYECFSVDKSFRTTYAAFSDELVNCDFMYDCRNCSDCFGCVGLRSKSYCIFNKQYSKEEYKKERAKYDLASYKNVSDIKKKFSRMVHEFPRKYALIRNAPGCTGDNVIDAKNSIHVFQALQNIENSKYVLVAGMGMKDSYDIAGAGLKSSLLYEVGSSTRTQRVFFSRRIQDSHDVFYSRECTGSAFLFGCVGLRSKKYCILNKQYSKEEYEALVPKIIEQMKTVTYVNQKGQVYAFGEFFPVEHSPLPYNRSWADEYFSLAKDGVIKNGYRWYESNKRSYEGLVQPDALPDHLDTVDDSILNKIIGCDHAGLCNHPCSGAFKIIPSELAFYRKLNLALPRTCPSCRYRAAAETHLTPYALWKRQCLCNSGQGVYKNTAQHAHGSARCEAIFETAYSPERTELLYCEPCYNAEIL